jgi:Ran GTPase-activating protein 1
LCDLRPLAARPASASRFQYRLGTHPSHDARRRTARRTHSTIGLASYSGTYVLFSSESVTLRSRDWRVSFQFRSAMGINCDSHFELDSSKREALTAERAEELLVGLSAGITSVKLGGKSFGDGSAKVAADALARAGPTLRHLDIADIIASRPEDEAKRALATIADGLCDCKTLISIDLSDNALGAKGIRAVGSLLAGQTALESLKLCNNGLAADAGELIASALTEVQPTKLQLLHFHNNLLETAGAIALAPIVESSPDLEDFRFSALRVHHEGAVRISRALACHAGKLRKLNLSDNNFGEDGSKELADALLGATGLRELILRDTALGDGGTVAVCNALGKAGIQLEVLDLSGNEMSARGAAAMAQAVSNMGYIRSLFLEDNELGSAGAKHLARVLSAVTHVTLEDIDASASEIGTSGALALAQAIEALPVFCKLKLNANAISAEVVREITSLLEDKLGSLSENDEDGEDEDDDDDADEDDEEEEEDEKEAGADSDKDEKEAKKQAQDGRKVLADSKRNASKPESDDTEVDDLTRSVNKLSVGET